jgi:hypothetical protein
MKMRLSNSLLVCAVLLHLAQGAVHAQSFADLSRYLPRDANALVIVDAKGLYDSPLGQRENWRQTFHDYARATPLLIPPSADQAVLASRIDIDTLTPDWEAAALRLSVDPSINEIAERLGGALDKLGGLDALWLGGKTCVVKFAPQTVALLTPVTRQEAARWLAGVTNPNPLPLSPYLHQALTQAEAGGPQIVLAVDMVDALPAAFVRTVVEQSQIFAKVPGLQAATFMSGLQGAKFAVQVDEQMRGTLQIDFATETAMLAPIAKPLMIGMLSQAGAMLEEFNNWQAEATGNSLILSGELTPVGMRRMLSLLAVDASTLGLAPTPPAETAAPAEAAPAEPEKDPTVVASQRYFRRVGHYIEDAQRLDRADSLRQSVMWLHNYARRVENLSTRYVDPELAQYGQHVAQTFRNVINEAYGVADKQATIEALNAPSQVQQGLLPTGRTVTVPGRRYFEYAPYYTATYNPLQQQQAAAEQKKLEDQIYAQVERARQTLTQLVADHETVRSKLSQRYGVQFR